MAQEALQPPPALESRLPPESSLVPTSCRPYEANERDLARSLSHKWTPHGHSPCPDVVSFRVGCSVTLRDLLHLRSHGLSSRTSQTAPIQLTNGLLGRSSNLQLLLPFCCSPPTLDGRHGEHRVACLVCLFLCLLSRAVNLTNSRCSINDPQMYGRQIGRKEGRIDRR